MGEQRRHGQWPKTAVPRCCCNLRWDRSSRLHPEIGLQTASAVCQGCVGIKGDRRPGQVNAIFLHQQVQIGAPTGWIVDVPDFLDHLVYTLVRYAGRFARCSLHDSQVTLAILRVTWQCHEPLPQMGIGPWKLPLLPVLLRISTSSKPK